MATYFTADLHFGHANIIKHCDRPFSTVEEMDEHLIMAWNSRVRQHDRVYIIGDFMFRNKESPTSYLSRMKGKKHLLLGNHDVKWTKKLICYITLRLLSVILKYQTDRTDLHYAIIR